MDRPVCNQEVAGSIPVVSTEHQATPQSMLSPELPAANSQESLPPVIHGIPFDARCCISRDHLVKPELVTDLYYNISSRNRLRSEPADGRLASIVTFLGFTSLVASQFPVSSVAIFSPKRALFPWHHRPSSFIVHRSKPGIQGPAAHERGDSPARIATIYIQYAARSADSPCIRWGNSKVFLVIVVRASKPIRNCLRADGCDGLTVGR